MPVASRMPVLFVAHGNPMLTDMPHRCEELATWASRLPRPRAILIISAHWLASPLTLGATRPVPLVYDFYGFAPKYYQVTYPAPGAPELAERLHRLLAGKLTLTERPDRGLDHGAYVPLLCMYPDADIPVLQLSLPSEDPDSLLELGRWLAPLRDEGVLIIASGYLTHNLRDWRGESTTADWALAFDDWVATRLLSRDLASLLDYRRLAPGVEQALPTHEHFVPLFVTLGAADLAEPLSFPIRGFEFGSFSHRSVQFGSGR